MSRDRFSGTPRIFLSYARKDGEEFATRLRNRLQTEQPEAAKYRTPLPFRGLYRTSALPELRFALEIGEAVSHRTDSSYGSRFYF